VVREGAVPSNNWFALPSSWSDPLVLMELYEYPSDIVARPVLYEAADRSWTSELKWQGEKLFWAHPFPTYMARPVSPPLHYVGRSIEQPVTEQNLIVLHCANGRIDRVAGDINIQGRVLHLKPPPRGGLPYPPGALFPLLVDENHLPVPMRYGKLTGPFSGVK